MFILGSDCFYVVVSLLWKNDTIFCQQFFIIRLSKYGFLLFYILCMNRVPKVPAIVAKTDIFAVQIFSGPVYSCQFTVIGIFSGKYYLLYYQEYIPMPDAERPRLESVKILNRQTSSIFCALPPEFLYPFSSALLYQFSSF